MIDRPSSGEIWGNFREKKMRGESGDIRGEPSELHWWGCAVDGKKEGLEI